MSKFIRFWIELSDAEGIPFLHPISPEEARDILKQLNKVADLSRLLKTISGRR
jgi:hypothetical protein